MSISTRLVTAENIHMYHPTQPQPNFNIQTNQINCNHMGPHWIHLPKFLGASPSISLEKGRPWDWARAQITQSGIKVDLNWTSRAIDIVGLTLLSKVARFGCISIYIYIYIYVYIYIYIYIYISVRLTNSPH